MTQRMRLLPLVVLLVAIVAATWWWATTLRDEEGPLTASGTIEVVQVSLSPELGGRVTAVSVQAGDTVRVGQTLVQLDTELLDARAAQAHANLAAAQASYDSLAAGPTAGQLSAAEAAVERAEVSLESLNDQLTAANGQEENTTQEVETLMEQVLEAEAALSAAGEEATSLPMGTPSEITAAAQAKVSQLETSLTALNAQLRMAEQLEAAIAAKVGVLESQITVAQATLDSSRAQSDLLLEGARPEQLAAARANVDAARAAVVLLETQVARQTITAPLDGVVLSRNIEPGETALPGATLLTLGQLHQLTITVYVPEDQYGQISLGQPAILTVDSFPDEEFPATVRQIEQKAEFTPRNVQTAEGRATTVFAVHLSITGGEGRLKPGMPADVVFAR